MLTDTTLHDNSLFIVSTNHGEGVIIPKKIFAGKRLKEAKLYAASLVETLLENPYEEDVYEEGFGTPKEVIIVEWLDNKPGDIIFSIAVDSSDEDLELE
jgi:hypothetical protein